MITAPQRRLLVLLSSAFFIGSLFYCCSRLAAMTFAPLSVEKVDEGPKIELLRADNPMSYGMYNRPAYDGIRLMGNLPTEHIPTLENGRRLVIIGDIHGMLDPFEKLLKQIEFSPDNDHIVAVGDMVNKGPHSAEVVARLMELKASAVRGNHEDRVILAWSSLNSQQGVQAFLDSEDAANHRGEAEDLQTARSLNESQLIWLKNLPVILSAEPMALYMVHAGLVPGIRADQQDPWAVMNMRTLRFPREEFRQNEILRKKKLEEKKKAEERKKKEELAKMSQKFQQRGDEAEDEGPSLHARVARAEPAQTDSSETDAASGAVESPTDGPAASGFDRDIWIPINGHEGERWTDLWNSEQKKLRGSDRRSVIYGHDAKMGYQEDSYTFGLDSGCVKGNALTALVIQAKEDGGWKHSTIQVLCPLPKKSWW
ncbi:hypothetical protein ACJZ2D_014244 [Fusarium nematophilum]